MLFDQKLKYETCPLNIVCFSSSVPELMNLVDVPKLCDPITTKLPDVFLSEMFDKTESDLHDTNEAVW